MKSKVLYNGEWVRVRNIMNKHFAANRPCSQCRVLSCSVVWYSIKTKEVRCLKCFTPTERRFLPNKWVKW